MHVSDAQREVRLTYMGGFPGGLVSGAMWLASAALGARGSIRNAILVLVLGGPFIFPLTRLVLTAMGRRATLDHANPLAGLAMQIAFTIPFSLPLIGAASLYKIEWFYPAFLVVVGAHYLPFVFLYGMWTFALLAILMIFSGVWIGLNMADSFSVGGWLGGILLVAFGILGLLLTGREHRQGTSAGT